MVIPRAMIAAVGTMFVFSIVVLFCVASQQPGISREMLDNTSFVLQYGLRNSNNLSPRFVPCLLLIPTFASACGFMFACKHQLSAMSESGLMPSFLQIRVGKKQVPRNALLTCLLVQYSIYLIVHYYQRNVEETYRLCCISACCMYILLFMSFLFFR